MNPVPEAWFTKEQIAKHFQVSETTVERINLPFTRVGGQNRYKVSVCERFLEEPAVEVDNVVELRPRQGAA